MDKIAQDSTIDESYKTVPDSNLATHPASPGTQPNSTASPSVAAAAAAAAAAATETVGTLEDCYTWVWEFDHSNLNKELGFDSGNISSFSSLENMDGLDVTLGSLTLADHTLLQPKMDFASFTALPLHIPSKSDGLPLTLEEEDWYEFITFTTRLEEWSQKRLEECWLPPECEFSLHVLDSREGRVMWGLLIVWYMNQGWLEHYRTIRPRDVIDAATVAAAAAAAAGSGGESDQAFDWTSVELDEVEVKVYRLSRAGREELKGVLRSGLMSGEGHEGDILMDGADLERKRVMSGMKALELGPPADAQS